MGWSCGRGCRPRGSDGSGEAAGPGGGRAGSDAHPRARGGGGSRDLEGSRPARLRAEVRGSLPRHRRPARVREDEEGLSRVDEGPHPLGPGPHRPPRLRDRRAVPQGRAVAAGPSVARGPRALLRAGARQLRAHVFVGGLAARTRRVQRESRPQGLDARADLRRGRPRVRRPLEGARCPRPPERQITRRVHRAQRLSAGNPANASRRAGLLLRRASRRFVGLEPRAVERRVRARPGRASPRRCEIGRRGPSRRSRGPSRRPARRRAGGSRGLARRTERAGGRLRGEARTAAAPAHGVHRG